MGVIPRDIEAGIASAFIVGHILPNFQPPKPEALKSFSPNPLNLEQLMQHLLERLGFREPESLDIAPGDAHCNCIDPEQKGKPSSTHEATK